MAITTSLKVAAEDVARSLGRFITTTCNGKTSAKQFTVNRILDLALDEETARDWFLYNPNATTPEWRRVDTVSGATVLTINDFSDPPENTETIQFYSILTPDQWRDIINASLRALSYEDRISIPLVAEQNLYAPTETWLESAGQILRKYFRDVSSGATDIWEAAVPFIKTIEDSNTLKFYIPVMPDTITNVTLEIAAKRPYDILGSDSATTTCPYSLLMAEGKWQALTMIYHQLGAARAKQLYGMEMVLAERERNKQRARWLPMVQYQEQDQDEPWQGVDFGGIPLTWSW